MAQILAPPFLHQRVEFLVLGWYTLVKEVATMLKEDLAGGNCPSYPFFSH